MSYILNRVSNKVCTHYVILLFIIINSYTISIGINDISTDTNDFTDIRIQNEAYETHNIQILYNATTF